MQKLKLLIQKMNEQGVPLPLLRINGAPTVTGTMAVISFTTALLGQIGKVTNLIGDVDLNNANYLVIITLGAYLGRRISGNKDNASLDAKNKEGQ
jgi:uncharacterized membrane protein YfcA